jgi:hypothetical protein
VRQHTVRRAKFPLDGFDLLNVLLANALQAIVSLSNTYPGRVHGKRLAAAMPYPLPVGSELLQDLGFIGLTFEGVGITQLPKKPEARH